MAYKRQGFADGMTLTAEHLKAMEDGIIGAFTGIQYVESAVNGTEEKVNLRDLESGVYMIYGYFSPYKDSNMSIGCNDLVHIIRKDAGTHLMCISPLNAKLTFIEILVDETQPGGHTYTRQNFNLWDIHGLLARVDALENGAVALTDAETGKRYKLSVVNTKLTMEEVTE